MQVHFADGTQHRSAWRWSTRSATRAGARRRCRGCAASSQANLSTAYDAEQVERIVAWFDDGAALADMTVSDFMDALVVEP